MTTEFKKILRELNGYTSRKALRERYLINKLKSKNIFDKDKWTRLLVDAEMDLVLFEIGAREMYDYIEPKINRDWTRLK